MERAGRAFLNSQIAQDVQLRPRRQEVGPPCGWEEERGPGGLQAWGRRNVNINAPGTTNAQDSQQTIPKERQRTRVRARARPGIPKPPLPHNTHSPPVGHFKAPHRCPHCEDIPDDIFPLPSYSANDPDPPPHYEDLFPPNYTHFPDLDTST